VLPLTRGEILAVDADAQVSPNRRVLPLFEREAVGAVQVRKRSPMAGRISGLKARWQKWLWIAISSSSNALGGIGELRQQSVARATLERCGGWNEETITDDLDLTCAYI